MKVLAADGISSKGIELLQKEFEVVVKDKLPAEELLEIIPDFDALIVRSASKVTAEVIARAKKLKIIGRAGVGVDNIDIPAATAKGIIVINSPGGNTIAATEHTMAMMLAMSRNIPIANETMHKGEWNRKKYVGVELRGKTLGVVGMGRIGSGVAKRAMAFDMNVLAYDPYINEERAKALGVKVATFDEVIENSDFITVHMPLTKETKGMIAMEQMKKMKPGVRLVNCARGGIIDEADLAEALKQGLVAAAAIDVYTSEPPAEKGNPLLEAPNIVLTPHLGASTVEAQIGVSVDVAKGIIAALHGEPVATAVNMAPVSPQVMRVIAPYLTLAERLGGTQAGHIVNALQMCRSIQPAGAVAKNDVRTARRQQLYQRADDGRMDCRSLLRLHGGDKIELQRHTHAGRDPVKPARRVDSGLQRSGNLRLFIAFAGGKRSIPVSIHTPSFRQRVGITNRYAPAL